MVINPDCSSSFAILAAEDSVARGINIENLERQKFVAAVAKVAAALVIDIEEAQCFRIDHLNRVVGFVDKFSKQA